MLPEDAPGLTDYRGLAARMGYGPLRARLKRQAGLWAADVHQGTGIFSLDAVVPMDRVVLGVLRVCGLERRGLDNYMDIRVVENRLPVARLPAAFEGFRLLHLSDLHCDLHPPLIGVLIELLAPLAYDAAVFTGDYHNKIAQPPLASLALMQQLIAAVRGPRFAILGNHDFIEKVAFLEAVGLPVLLNEAAPLRHGGATLWIGGIDDPHYFRAGDLVRVRSQIPQGEPAILLSHSPEPYREAERHGFTTMLCGHTHGGQLCLPGGIPVIRNTRAPRRCLSGPWTYHRLNGYTSRGTGACGVAARFFCPPEATIHTLHPAP
jgi:uncharacterized protein